MPDFSVEDRLGGAVAGIDEAGRGPLAGPVFAAAVMLDRARLPREMLDGLDDSKKLTRRARAAMYDLVMANARTGVGQASVAEIDGINILQATMLAMRRAFEDLPGRPQFAIVDGNRAPDLGCPTSCLIGGDASSLTIAAASIVAKVTRDRLMAALAREHPGYGWRRNAGYGTREHLAALDRLGVTPHHRRTFAPVARLCNTKAR
jgi:ribonuclease HII